MTPTPAAAVVVLNWNNAEDTLACLESLRRSSVPLYVAVVDNGSVDESADQIESSGMADVLIRTGQNLGYAGGNNVGLGHALSSSFRLVAVLNNDTIAPPDLFDRLLRHVEQSPNAALSPTIVYADQPDSIWFAGGTVDKGWPRHLQKHELPDPGDPLQGSETLTGCLLVAAPEVWRRVGLFDGGLFLIFEDSDWSMRARHAGVDLYVARDCVLQHKVSRSFRKGPMRYLGTFFFVRNGLCFQWRYSRSFLPRFIYQWVLRPTAAALVRRESMRSSAFAWIGLFCSVVGQSGTAPAVVFRLAERAALSGDRRD